MNAAEWSRAPRGGIRVAAAIICLGCVRMGTPAESELGRVLFVGNSLTLANNLPAMVEAVGRASGGTVEAAAVAFPNYSLEDHWNRGEAGRAIARGDWKFVVLQQGPSALPESRELLISYVRRFDALIRGVGARTALYMVWPAKPRGADLPAVRASYEAAAKAVGGTLLPVGESWRAAWRSNSRLPLYGADGFHPSPLATALAAMVIYEGLFARSASVPADWAFEAADVQTIRAAAAVSLERGR